MLLMGPSTYFEGEVPIGGGVPKEVYNSQKRKNVCWEP